jgi:hypothetical protein
VSAQAEPHEQCVLIRDLEIDLRHWGGPVGRLVWRWRLRQRPWGSRSARCRRDVDRIGLAYRDGFVLVLVADQEGIWRVPDISGSVRAGRPDQPKITDVPPEQRKPVPAAYGQELITPRGVFGVIAGHQNRHLALDPQTGAMFVGVGSSGNNVDHVLLGHAEPPGNDLDLVGPQIALLHRRDLALGLAQVEE